MSTKSTDQLAAALEHIRSWATAQRVAMVPGDMIEDRDGVPGIHFADQTPDSESQPLASAKAFTKTLSELDVAMLAVSVVTLDEESWKAAVGLYEDEPEILDGPEGDEVQSVVRSLLADARAAQDHIGQPGSVSITAITRNPTVTIVWFEMAEWYAVIEAADHAFTQMAESVFDDDEDFDEEIFDDEDFDDEEFEPEKDGWQEEPRTPRP